MMTLGFRMATSLDGRLKKRSSSSLRWHGHAKLWPVFWLISIFGNVLFAFAFGICWVFLAFLQFLIPVSFYPTAMTLVVIAWSAFSVFCWVSTWRCASNCGFPACCVLTRIFSVLAFLGFALFACYIYPHFVIPVPGVQASVTASLLISPIILWFIFRHGHAKQT